MMIDASAATLLGDTAPVAGSVSGSTAGGYGLGLIILAILAFNLVSFSVIGATTGCIAAVLVRGVALWKAAASGVAVGIAAAIASVALLDFILAWALFVGPMLVAFITLAIVLMLKRRAARGGIRLETPL